MLACRELLSSPEASLGNDPLQRDRPKLSPVERSAYDEVIEARGLKGSAAAVLKTVDPSVRLAMGRLNGATIYFDGDKPPEGVIGARPLGWENAPDGRTALYSARQLLELELSARDNCGTQREVVDILGLSPASLQDLSVRDRGRDVWLVRADGEVNPPLEDALRRRTDKAVSRVPPRWCFCSAAAAVTW